MFPPGGGVGKASLTNRKRSRTSRSNPSSHSRFRSALRSVSGFDIEHHFVFDLDGLTSRERAIRVGLRTVVVRHGEVNVSAGRRRREGESDNLLVGDALFLNVVLFGVHNDVEPLVRLLPAVEVLVLH